MRETKLGNVLENAARLAGRAVDAMGVPENWRALAELSVNEALQRLAAEKFPMLRRVEFRRYRPTWTSNAGWSVGNECWYGDDYWRMESVVNGNIAPNQAGSGWRKLEMSEVAAFIAWEQPWENTIMDRGSVDRTRFAFVSDPKYCSNPTPVRATSITEMGVTLEQPAPKGVYCLFVPQMPRVSFLEWSSTANYEAGDVVYLTSSRDVYQAVGEVKSGEVSPTSNAKWQRIRVAGEFESYLTRAVAADLLTEDQGKFQTKAAADSEFERLCERFHEGVGETKMRTGRFV